MTGSAWVDLLATAVFLALISALVTAIFGSRYRRRPDDALRRSTAMLVVSQWLVACLVFAATVWLVARPIVEHYRGGGTAVLIAVIVSLVQYAWTAARWCRRAWQARDVPSDLSTVVGVLATVAMTDLPVYWSLSLAATLIGAELPR